MAPMWKSPPTPRPQSRQGSGPRSPAPSENPIRKPSRWFSDATPPGAGQRRKRVRRPRRQQPAASTIVVLMIPPRPHVGPRPSAEGATPPLPRSTPTVTVRSTDRSIHIGRGPRRAGQATRRARGVAQRRRRCEGGFRGGRERPSRMKRECPPDLASIMEANGEDAGRAARGARALEGGRAGGRLHERLLRPPPPRARRAASRRPAAAGRRAGGRPQQRPLGARPQGRGPAR